MIPWTGSCTACAGCAFRNEACDEPITPNLADHAAPLSSHLRFGAGRDLSRANAAKHSSVGEFAHAVHRLCQYPLSRSAQSFVGSRGDGLRTPLRTIQPESILQPGHSLVSLPERDRCPPVHGDADLSRRAVSLARAVVQCFSLRCTPTAA